MNNNKLNHENIDPFAENAGEFLDFDLQACFEQGYKAYEEGHYEDAAKYFLLVLKHNIKDYGSIYMLASLYGLMGKAELAAKYLDKAVKNGFTSMLHINQNEAFSKVKDTAIFKETIENAAAYIKNKEKAHGDVIYLDSSALFKCLVKLPENYDPKKEYTLAVGLHGRGNTPEEFIDAWQDVALVGAGSSNPAKIPGSGLEPTPTSPVGQTSHLSTTSDDKQDACPDGGITVPVVDVGNENFRSDVGACAARPGFAAQTPTSAEIKQDFILAAPQAHYPFLFNNNVGYSWNMRVEDDNSTFETTTKMSIGYIAEIIMELQYRLPVKDIYLAGFSQGASFALQAGLKHYEHLKGIMVFSGFLPPDWFVKSGVEVEKAEGLRIFMAHGKRDKSVRMVKSHEIRDQLIGCGLSVTHHEFDDGHTLPPDVVKLAWEWMKGK